MANTHATLTSLFTNIADKIRVKTGNTGSIVADNFPEAIDSILTPADGSIPTRTSSNLTASGATVTVPSGYYASQVTKSVDTITQATPSITVDSNGLITASATQTAGYVSNGSKSATKQLTTQAAKTITPSTSNQTAVASGVYTTGAITVAGDADLIASNIVEGKQIFNVTGNVEPASALADELAAQDNLIAQLMTALENKAGVTNVVVGEITTTSSNPSIVISDAVGKDNVVLMYMSSGGYQASAMADAGVGSTIVHGTSHSYTIMYASELSAYSDDGFIEYDNTTGTITLAQNMRYNETFIAGKYIYVTW